MDSTGARRAGAGRGLLAFVLAFALLYVMDGSRQPTSGSGWQVIAYQRGLGRVGTVTAIGDQPALEAAFDFLHLAAPPVVDFGRSAVFVFVGIGTVGCPDRFEGIDFDLGRRVVSAAFARRLMFDCDPSRVPDSFIVALDRARLPPAPFRVQAASLPAVGVVGSSIDVAK
jgi:hypothetical protein